MSAEPTKFRIYDTLSGNKVELEPVEPGKISMYVCGVTVYDLTHIGHARVFVFFDVVQRVLRHFGWDLTYVRNHTDVDDKIIARANEVDEDPLALAQRFIEALDEDMGRLLVAHADHEPRVSETIEEIIEMTKTLIDRGYAYEAGGDVYYRVQKFDGYGKLSGRKLEDMEAGRSGRVDDDKGEKEYPFDFALWKAAKDGDVSWDSPWGQGRPGWHIECSAMSQKFLGETFDIHGGGRDLIFPHHENEIAQSEGASGQPFANHWMHVGMVNVAERDEDGNLIERKMSKSLGNFWTTRDVLKGYHPEAIRYFMHTTQYRHPITYSQDNLDDATDRLEYLYTTIERVEKALEKAEYTDGDELDGSWFENKGEVLEGFMQRYDEALADDFNTPRALAAIGELAKIANDLTESNKKAGGDRLWSMVQVRDLMREAGKLLGILEKPASVALTELRDLKVELLGIDTKEVEELIKARTEARASKDWDRADAVRDELADMNVEVLDSPEGTTWRIRS